MPAHRGLAASPSLSHIHDLGLVALNAERAQTVAQVHHGQTPGTHLP